MVEGRTQTDLSLESQPVKTQGGSVGEYRCEKITVFEKQGTSSDYSEATKETCQHAKTEAAMPYARCNIRIVQLLFGSCQQPRRHNTKPIFILASGCFRTMCFGRNPLSGQQPEQHGDGTSCQCFSQKLEIFPEFGVSARQILLFPPISAMRKGIKLIKSKIDDFNLRLPSWLKLGRMVASKVTFLDLGLCWLTNCAHCAPVHILFLWGQSKGMEIKFRSGGESQWVF